MKSKRVGIFFFFFKYRPYAHARRTCVFVARLYRRTSYLHSAMVVAWINFTPIVVGKRRPWKTRVGIAEKIKALMNNVVLFARLSEEKKTMKKTLGWKIIIIVARVVHRVVLYDNGKCCRSTAFDFGSIFWVYFNVHITSGGSNRHLWNFVERSLGIRR